MEKIRKLRTEIGALASALEQMNDNVTPETALTIKVATEVFGQDLADMQAELDKLILEHSAQTLIVI
jgi:hypothetical protein|tara:strand:+ start:4101 stop:4301 length:201 start_codon:yes stop_codon:yes gene_type:complete